MLIAQLSRLTAPLFAAVNTSRQRAAQLRADRAYWATAQSDPRIMAELQAAVRANDADAWAEDPLRTFDEPLHVRRGRVLA